MLYIWNLFLTSYPKNAYLCTIKTNIRLNLIKYII